MPNEIKEYNKVIKLSNTQAVNILNQLCKTDLPEILDHTFMILTHRCKVQVDRSNITNITIFSDYGKSKFYKEESQNCRLLIIAAITAKNYSHFYSNVKKKLKRLPIKQKM